MPGKRVSPRLPPVLSLNETEERLARLSSVVCGSATSILELHAEVQALHPEVGAVGHQCRACRAEQGPRTGDGLDLADVQARVDLVAGPHHVGAEDERVADVDPQVLAHLIADV